MAGPDDYFDDPAAKRMAWHVAKDDTHAAIIEIDRNSVGAFHTGAEQQGWLSIAIQAGAKRTFHEILSRYGLAGAKKEMVGQALYHAVLADEDHWLDALHAAGADLNAFGGGELLLLTAAQTKNPTRLEFFIQNGADLNTPTNLGEPSVLSLARTANYPALMQLLNGGASPWATSIQGRTIGYWLEKTGSNPVWDLDSKAEQQRQDIILFLRRAGVPHPPPATEEVIRQIATGEWGR